MFAQRLRWLRECKEITQLKMSEFLNLAPPSYHGYESGKNKPPMDTLIKIADYFEVSVDYLLGLTDIPERNFIRLTDHQQSILAELRNLSSEQLEILATHDMLGPNLKQNLYDYCDFCLQLEARDRIKNQRFLNASKDHNTPALEDNRQNNIKNFHEQALYNQLKNQIKKSIE